jgi:protein phosphatase PTC7
MFSVKTHVQRILLIRNQLKNFTVNSKFSNTFNTKLKFKFNSGTIKIPHFSKKEKGGEDALATHDGMICVADGVGGWADQGVDPGIYSNQLASNVKKYFLEEGLSSYNDPMRFFVKACNDNKEIGSSTCCICVLDLEKNYVHTLNMGDSGYLLLRPIKSKDKDDLNAYDLEIVYKSEEQTHGFNFPYQVGTGGDDPESAVKMVHEIQENDIIVLATDGLWDNLYETQIMSIIKPFLSIDNEIKDLEIVAEMIGKTAEQFSLNQRYKSPFALRSRGLFNGGKADDITIIVSQIINNV